MECHLFIEKLSEEAILEIKMTLEPSAFIFWTFSSRHSEILGYTTFELSNGTEIDGGCLQLSGERYLLLVRMFDAPPDSISEKMSYYLLSYNSENFPGVPISQEQYNTFRNRPPIIIRKPGYWFSVE